MRFGCFLLPFHEPTTSPYAALRQDIELCGLVDDLGFDEIWLGEHHSSGWSTLSAPDLLIAALARAADDGRLRGRDDRRGTHQTRGRRPCDGDRRPRRATRGRGLHLCATGGRRLGRRERPRSSGSGSVWPSHPSPPVCSVRWTRRSRWPRTSASVRTPRPSRSAAAENRNNGTKRTDCPSWMCAFTLAGLHQERFPAGFQSWLLVPVKPAVLAFTSNVG